jgi:hypothetical protein
VYARKSAPNKWKGPNLQKKKRRKVRRKWRGEGYVQISSDGLAYFSEGVRVFCTLLTHYRTPMSRWQP